MGGLMSVHEEVPEIPAAGEDSLVTRIGRLESEVKTIRQGVEVLQATTATKSDLAELQHATRADFAVQRAHFETVMAEHRHQTRLELLEQWQKIRESHMSLAGEMKEGYSRLEGEIKATRLLNKADVADARTAMVIWVAGIVFIGQLIPSLVRLLEKYL